MRDRLSLEDAAYGRPPDEPPREPSSPEPTLTKKEREELAREKEGYLAEIPGYRDTAGRYLSVRRWLSSLTIAAALSIGLYDTVNKKPAGDFIKDVGEYLAVGSVVAGSVNLGRRRYANLARGSAYKAYLINKRLKHPQEMPIVVTLDLTEEEEEMHLPLAA